jgi:hypothetical protein
MQTVLVDVLYLLSVFHICLLGGCLAVAWQLLVCLLGSCLAVVISKAFILQVNFIQRIKKIHETRT